MSTGTQDTVPSDLLYVVRSVFFHHGGDWDCQGVLGFFQDNGRAGGDSSDQFCVLICDADLCGDDALAGTAAFFFAGRGDRDDFAVDGLTV